MQWHRHHCSKLINIVTRYSERNLIFLVRFIILYLLVFRVNLCRDECLFYLPFSQFLLFVNIKRSSNLFLWNFVENIQLSLLQLLKSTLDILLVKVGNICSVLTSVNASHPLINSSFDIYSFLNPVSAFRFIKGAINNRNAECLVDWDENSLIFCSCNCISNLFLGAKFL